MRAINSTISTTVRPASSSYTRTISERIRSSILWIPPSSRSGNGKRQEERDEGENLALVSPDAGHDYAEREHHQREQQYVLERGLPRVAATPSLPCHVFGPPGAGTTQDRLPVPAPGTARV